MPNTMTIDELLKDGHRQFHRHNPDDPGMLLNDFDLGFNEGMSILAGHIRENHPEQDEIDRIRETVEKFRNIVQKSVDAMPSDSDATTDDLIKYGIAVGHRDAYQNVLDIIKGKKSIREPRKN